MTNEQPPPDPRPTVRSRSDGGYEVRGWRCARCTASTAMSVRRCPTCGGPLAETYFGPLGTVWSDTTVHVPVPGRTPPYRIAYVDLDDGPRVAADLDTPPGRPAPRRVRLTGTSERGDVTVAAAEEA
ncbi:MAG TPA: OB-fold domain-containing protein [Pseudonocardiaceae bacterium]|nr:OB-fold domain-containing protein [Pseudonocardiaceae bacterium]